MSTLYLLRHGKPGPREDYDQLSATGREQARLLGRHLAARSGQYQHALVGTLRRQKLSAETALHQFPTPIRLHTDARWNEFDFFHLYDEVAPSMERILPGFHEAETSQDQRDYAVLTAWVRGHLDYSGESWAGFVRRIHAAFEDAAGSLDGGPVLVFTSATPTAVALGRALGLPPAEVNRIAGSLRHASISAVRRDAGQWALLHENETPHLDGPLQTSR